MKLEVGMYARYNGNIGKLVYEFKNGNWNIYGIGIAKINNEKSFKASHKIIDLIEKNDYVNGYRVEYKDNVYLYDFNDSLICHVSEIETIVTKEQFNSMKFEVK